MTAIKPRSPHAPGTTPAKTTAAPAVPQPQKPLTGWQQGGVVKMDSSTRHQQHEMANGNIFNRSFNVLELRSGPAKHAADSAILNSGAFDESRFQAFVAHADRNGRMTLSSFAAAIADQARRDSSGPAAAALPTGKAIALVEYSALLSIFGTKDKATGEVGIPVTQLRDLFQHQKLPPTTGASISESTAIAASMKVKVDANLSVRAFDSNSTITGQAKAGIRLANNGVSTTGAAANAAASAGKAANCPHLNNQAPMPGQVKDAVNAHTAVGLPR